MSQQRYWVWGVGLALPFSLLVSALSLLAGALLSVRQRGWYAVPHSRWLLGLMGLVLAITLSHGTVESWQGSVNYWPWLLVPLLWFQLGRAEPGAAQALGRSLVIGSVPLAVFGYLQVPLGWFGQWQLIPHILIFDSIAFAPPELRPTAVLLNPNALALYLLLCLCLATSVFRWGWLLCGLHVPLILWTESRNIWLVGLVLLGAIASHRRWWWLLGLWLLCVLLVGGGVAGWPWAMLLLPERIAERLNGIWLPGTTAYTAAIRRWDGWLFALDLVRDRPLRGWGWNQFYQLYGARPLEPVLEYLGHAHNIGLQLAAEGGVLVMAAFMGLWGWLLGRWQGWPWALLAYLLAGGLDVFYLDGRFNLFFWLLLAVAWPLPKAAASQQTKLDIA